MLLLANFAAQEQHAGVAAARYEVIVRSIIYFISAVIIFERAAE